MSSPVASVLIASAQSISMVYVIGAVGALAVNFPKSAPLLPATLVGKVARFGFHCLVLPLIYGTIAKSVSVDSIGDYWFVFVSALVVVSVSYAYATVIGYIVGIHTRSPTEFDVLRISASFPNILSLPILIFPSLCEYPVVYEGYFTGDEDAPSDEKYIQCVDRSNTMIFCYFFSWSFLFWSMGYHQLMTAANRNASRSRNTSVREEGEDEGLHPQTDEHHHQTWTIAILWKATKQTFVSPGFIAMILGFITACIPPLQQALFSPGGSIRFLGAAAEALGRASSPISTIVVAASLVPEQRPDVAADIEEESGSTHSRSTDIRSTGLNAAARLDEESSHPGPENHYKDAVDQHGKTRATDNCGTMNEEASEIQESPIMSDPNFGPLQRRRRSSILRLRLALETRSSMVFTTIRRRASRSPHSEGNWTLHVWFTLSKLIVSPALICALIIGLDCGGTSNSIPNLSKLVVILNAALPGALVVVILLKSRPAFADSATIVARVYLPSYLLSILTITAWTAVGLLITLPDRDDGGNSFCTPP